MRVKYNLRSLTPSTGRDAVQIAGRGVGICRATTKIASRKAFQRKTNNTDSGNTVTNKNATNKSLTNRTDIGTAPTPAIIDLDIDPCSGLPCRLTMAAVPGPRRSLHGFRHIYLSHRLWCRTALDLAILCPLYPGRIQCEGIDFYPVDPLGALLCW
jgi:hypothetical protein